MSQNDRYQLIKAFVFPEFLYLFRAISLDLSPKILQTWQSALNKYFWLCKAKNSFSPTLSPQGGLNYPNMLLYYKITLLSKIVRALREGDTLDWMNTLDHLYNPGQSRTQAGVISSPNLTSAVLIYSSLLCSKYCFPPDFVLTHLSPGFLPSSFNICSLWVVTKP